MIYELTAGIFLLLSAAFFIRSAWERKHPVLTSYTVENENLPEAFKGLKIAFLSDLHGDQYGEGQKTLIEMVEALKPDLILFGGDMITVKKWKKADFSGLEMLLQAFSGRFPLYYGYGNHEIRMRENKKDYPGWQESLDALLQKYGVRVLSNESAVIGKREQSLFLSGLDLQEEHYKKGRKKSLSQCYIEERLGKKKEGFDIILCHSPLYLPELSAWGASLVLSGHFHGGTVRLPGLGGVMTPQFQFFSKYTKGAVFRDGTEEIVSAGLGTHSINIRFLNRPEIVAVTLERKTHES